jgi:hypothetical protein
MRFVCEEKKMPGLKYRVKLSVEEKEMLELLLRKGKSAARRQTRARIQLKADGEQDKEIMKALSVSAATVYRTRQKCVEEGVEAALQEKPRPGAKPKLTERQNAKIIALACTHGRKETLTNQSWGFSGYPMLKLVFPIWF